MLKDANDRLALMQKLQRDPTQGDFESTTIRLASGFGGFGGFQGCFIIWMCPKIGVHQNGWFIMVPNPIKMDDLGVFPYFWFNTHINETQVDRGSN